MHMCDITHSHVERLLHMGDITHLHFAVVARGLGKICVVVCIDVQVWGGFD